jgi:hypothetical protein
MFGREMQHWAAPLNESAAAKVFANGIIGRSFTDPHPE